MWLRARLALSIIVGGWLTAHGQTEPLLLELGQKRAHEITTGGAQEHDILLKAGEYARLQIA